MIDELLWTSLKRKEVLLKHAEVTGYAQEPVWKSLVDGDERVVRCMSQVTVRRFYPVWTSVRALTVASNFIKLSLDYVTDVVP